MLVNCGVAILFIFHFFRVSEMVGRDVDLFCACGDAKLIAVFCSSFVRVLCQHVPYTRADCSACVPERRKGTSSVNALRWSLQLVQERLHREIRHSYDKLFLISLLDMFSLNVAVNRSETILNCTRRRLCRLIDSTPYTFNVLQFQFLGSAVLSIVEQLLWQLAYWLHGFEHLSSVAAVNLVTLNQVPLLPVLSHLCCR